MARIGNKLRSIEGGRAAFMCPGCKMMHQVRVEGQGRPLWGYNGNPDAPTFSPSVLVQGTVPITDEEHARIMAGEVVETKPLRCHSFVEAGRIRFLGDCTHELAGQTVELPNIEDHA